MITNSELMEGEYYFFLTYQDSDLRIPIIHTVRYTGRSEDVVLNDRMTKYWCFEMVGDDVDKRLQRVEEDLLFSIYDWDGLIRELSQNRSAQVQGVPYNGDA